VIDPGVGTARAILLATADEQHFVLPDNGLITLVARRAEALRLIRLDQPRFWRSPVSDTFHGRDIMAPVAAHLAAGTPPSHFGTEINDYQPWGWPAVQVDERSVSGAIVLIDSFGNLLTNIEHGMVVGASAHQPLEVELLNRRLVGTVRTYGDAPAGELIAMFSSRGRLELAVVNGSAAKLLRAKTGDLVRVSW
jgi:S-adenosylmethionine hydrolase